MNDRPNRADTDRTDLVAHVAERIRTHPDPLLRARAVQIIGIKEGMQAIDRWTDPRGAVIAHNELRRRVHELAAAAELADLEQGFRLSGQHPARHGGDLAFYGFFGLTGPAAYLLSAFAVELPPSLDGFSVVAMVMAALTPIAAYWCYYTLHSGQDARGWQGIVEQAAHAAYAGRDDHTSDQPPVNGDDDLARRRADAARALEDLLAAWGHYKLDTEAWYLTKPLLHDTTTAATTVAYNTAMADLTAAVEALHGDSPASDIDHALDLADRAWAAWHDANDHAAAVGLDDRSPTERAALQRLNKLVTRLTHSSADATDLAAVKRDITLCLDRIHTISVSWADIAALPALDQRLIPQLPSGITPSNPDHHFDEKVTQ